MIFCKTKKQIEDIKNKVKSEFSIQDLEELKYCLGIEIHRKRSKRLIMIHQQAYIRRLAEKFGLQKFKDVHTPA